MKITIVTAAYNSAATIEDTLRSVAGQTHPDIEHIIVDGKSTDATLEIVARFPHVARVISEPDDGLYDAMNKGLSVANGEAVGFLNSDDFFADTDAIAALAAALEGHDAVTADVAFVARDQIERVIRVQRTRGYRRWMLRIGHMPPHPTLYVRTSLFRRLGGFDPTFRIAGDFEFCVRLLLKQRASLAHVPRVLVGFRMGGVSTKNLKSTVTINREIKQALSRNGVTANLAMLYLRYSFKWIQFFRRATEYHAPPSHQVRIN